MTQKYSTNIIIWLEKYQIQQKNNKVCLSTLKTFTTIEIKINSRSHNYLIAIDGRNQSCAEETIITVKKADYKQLIVRRREHSFILNLREKLMWGADQRE